MREPAEYAAAIERDAMVPAGSGERFYGYGVMGSRSGPGTSLRSDTSRRHPSARAIARSGTAPRRAGLALRAGRVRLTGLTPNEQRFVANPLRLRVADESVARLHGSDLGAMGPVPEQAQLRDFAVPQRGLFVVGRTCFGERESVRAGDQGFAGGAGGAGGV